MQRNDTLYRSTKGASAHVEAEGTQADRDLSSLFVVYARALTLLDKYEADQLEVVKEERQIFRLSVIEVQRFIKELKRTLMRRGEADQLFGQENGDRWRAILANIDQTFDGKELYPSLEEKAAHLLYSMIKDFPFVDGNKRIGSLLFIYFLAKNHYLYKDDGERKINDNGLVALALLVASSKPAEKDKLIQLITHLVAE